MPRKKAPEIKKTIDPNVVGLKAEVISQPITETLEQNYMPYAMSVIVSRAIPEIDGFKPSHRKLLYTMYKMNLLTGGRTKSANIVGQTMRLNPHGDAAIYETMVRLSKGYGALLTPFVDSKGNFGKVYSRDMSYAASRYTEAKLAPICAELFGDIDKRHRGFCRQLRRLHERAGPAADALSRTCSCRRTLGIAVGMASQHLRLQPRGGLPHDDRATSRTRTTTCSRRSRRRTFPTGGEIVYDRDEMAADLPHRPRQREGARPLALRCRRKTSSRSTRSRIPRPSRPIIDKVAELVKAGKLREIGRHARRDRPQRPEARHRPQARRGPRASSCRSSSGSRR